jgi:Family of unknown function (DUF5670)
MPCSDVACGGIFLARSQGPRQHSEHIFGGKKVGSMFLILAVVLILCWIFGLTLFHVSGFLIHLLVIFAVISIIMHFIGGRRST